MKKTLNRGLLLTGAVTGGLGLALRLWVQSAPAQQVEQWYVQGIFAALSPAGLWLNSRFPFSVTEVLIMAALVAVPALIVWLIRRWIRCPQGRRALLKRLGSVLAAAAGCGFFLFMITGGGCYYRLSYAQLSGLPVQDSSVGELAGLCVQLAYRTNEAAALVERNEAGEMVSQESFSQWTLQAQEAYKQLSDLHGGILKNGSLARPKAVFFDQAMSYSRITGIYFFTTFEPNINTDTPHYSIPYTICHEMAHACGFMREDEANYIAYLVSSQSTDPEFRYSGLSAALSNSLNALYSTGYTDLYNQITSLVDEEIWADFAANNAYWDRYETQYGEFAESVNDTYLKANHQQDGVKSYGRMVDLLLAEYRAGGGTSILEEEP